VIVQTYPGSAALIRLPNRVRLANWRTSVEGIEKYLASGMIRGIGL